MNNLGNEMHDLCSRLFPICRSLTGNGFRKSLHIIQEHLPNLTLHEVPTGTQCFDWTVPKEWNIHDAYILNPHGKKICDFQHSNLHVVGYSTPVHKTISLDELQAHLYSLPDQPDAIPYITSYYNERWGFCITHNEREQLIAGEYTVVIDSELKDGSLTYGELIIPGVSDQEVFLSTYLCHPSMANNELSGPVVTTFLCKWLMALKNKKYTYRIIIIPETIGSITYLSKNVKHMKQKTIAGFNITCVGDDRSYSYLPSRDESSLADRVAKHVFNNEYPDYVTFSFLDRGSDERQYCSPGVDLPVCSMMRTRYGSYPEYHTSLDNLDLVTPKGLAGGYEMLKRALECLELNDTLQVVVTGEPQLGKRGLYPTLGLKTSQNSVKNMMNLLAYADGNHDLIDIAETIKVPLWDLTETIQSLKDANLLKQV
ncbi:MAG: DUF4910 domain-containing protein [Fibrobacterales bacterium]